MAEAGHKYVVLVGGNMGRNDGVDYSQWFARDFPDMTFYSTEGKPDVLEEHIEEADVVIGDVPERLLARAKRLKDFRQTDAAQTTGVHGGSAGWAEAGSWFDLSSAV